MPKSDTGSYIRNSKVKFMLSQVGSVGLVEVGWLSQEEVGGVREVRGGKANVRFGILRFC